MRIRSETTEQQGSDYMYSLVSGIMAGQGNVIIGDSSAVTIAAWWQAPTGSGKAFAELASTGRADSDKLQSAVIDSFPEADSELDRAALLLFGMWVATKMW